MGAPGSTGFKGWTSAEIADFRVNRLSQAALLDEELQEKCSHGAHPHPTRSKQGIVSFFSSCNLMARRPYVIGVREHALSETASWALSPTGLVWPAESERPKAHAVVGPCGALVRSLACQLAEMK